MTAPGRLRLKHEGIGQGPALFLLHGLFGSRRNWLGIARRLAENARVIAIDLRNHGDSPHAPDMAYPDMAGDLLSLADTLGLDAVHVAGHSMGGKVAMTFALQWPERTRSLSVLDIAPVTYGPAFDDLVDAMRALPAGALDRRSDAETYLQNVMPDLATRQFLLQNLVREGRGFRWRINLDAIRMNLPAIYGFPDLAGNAGFRGPVRFLAGARSEYILPRYEPAIRKHFPGAVIHGIPDAGHWIHADQPATVAMHLNAAVSAAR